MSIAAVSSTALLRAAEPKVEETTIANLGAGGTYVVSQNEVRIAYIGAKGTKTVVTVDGVEGPVLDELFGGSAAQIGNPGGCRGRGRQAQSRRPAEEVNQN